MKTGIAFLLLPSLAFAQVANDDIEKAILLKKGIIHSSATADCTVQWTCVDESLTGKCIKYHNDQWFTYRADSTQNLFINIGQQSCRDTRGVQLVVIDGVSCDPSTYRVLSCISLATQDDIFAEVSVEMGKEYLINIDGYLNDFCKFEISVDDKPKGFPIVTDISIVNEAALKRRIVSIRWKLTDSIVNNIAMFEMYKRKGNEFRSVLFKEVILLRNARGVPLLDYSFSDTIYSRDSHHYKLIAVDHFERKWLINDYHFAVDQTELSVPEINELVVPMTFWKDVPVKVLVWNSNQSLLLKTVEFIEGERKDDDVIIRLDQLPDNVKEVMIEVVNKKTNQRNMIWYSLD